MSQAHTRLLGAPITYVYQCGSSHSDFLHGATLFFFHGALETHVHEWLQVTPCLVLQVPPWGQSLPQGQPVPSAATLPLERASSAPAVPVLHFPAQQGLLPPCAHLPHPPHTSSGKGWYLCWSHHVVTFDFISVHSHYMGHLGTRISAISPTHIHLCHMSCSWGKQAPSLFSGPVLGWPGPQWRPLQPVPGRGTHVPAQPGSGAGHAEGAVPLVGSEFRRKSGARAA